MKDLISKLKIKKQTTEAEQKTVDNLLKEELKSEGQKVAPQTPVSLLKKFELKIPEALTLLQTKGTITYCRIRF